MKPRASSGVRWIRPTRGFAVPDLQELWRYRELLILLAARNVKLRYRQTVLGGAWAILNPLLMVGVFTLFLGRLEGVAAPGVPYALFAFSGLLGWTFFSQGVNSAASSVTGQQQLVTKVYFPRLVLPISAVVTGLIDFAIGLVLLVAFALAAGFVPGLPLLMVVPLLALAALTSLGVGLWLSALNVRFRDVSHMVPFILQIWMFSTPVIYSRRVLPEELQPLFAMNPMATVVEGFRWAVLGTPAPQAGSAAASVAISAILVLTGSLFFRATERTLADVV